MSSLLSRFLIWEKDFPQDIFLRQPNAGSWQTWTWHQAADEAKKVASGLRSLGLKPGDHVALLSKNCAQWVIADIAIMMAGCVSIPIYPTLSAHSIFPILHHSDAKAIILGKLDDFAQQKEGIPADIQVISMEKYGLHEGRNWEKMIEENPPLDDLYSWKQEDVITIIYTSGTTGKSKGVMHTVEAFEIIGPLVTKELMLPYRPDLFSYLPLSHIAERMAVELYGIFNGARISFAESLESFSENLEATQPHLFFAVPRIWGKLREGLLKKIPQKKLNLLLAIPIVSTVIKKSIKKKLGLSRASHIYSAAAPISVDLLQWFQKLGITIFQAYGMTEDCIYSHFDRPGQYKFGKVGKPLSGLQTKIAENGELREKSRGNMKGYYKEPELTAEAFDEENYLKTGDMGEYDKDGYLQITGRVKDIFKTDKGKYISPAPIETKLLGSPKIENACVVGTGVPQPIALITLSDVGKLVNQSELLTEFSQLIKTINTDLEKHERLEKIVIMKDNWTIANGLLTPTLKVKRNEIEKKHLPKYPEWYNEKELLVWEKQ